ncbi:lysosomal amino acid transporter 1-like [Anneissia japonica]|uniref:lysosomal amino acid transporter 1-like n=1 Tax=Anneissia japonica TaxID=1529436 RepID=UPI0014256D0A|nr:lysosomal amino acid transporter 1-like [Anneissia japonica]
MKHDATINGYDSSENCTSGSAGVYNVFNMCLVSVIQHIGFGVSFIAIALWFGSHFLMLKTNYQDSKTSFNHLFFTLHLALANVFNLIGCVLSNQIGTMVLTAIYFLVMDTIFIGQYFYNVYAKKPRPVDGFQYSNFSHPGVVNNLEWKSIKQKSGSLTRHKTNGAGFRVLCIGTSCVLTVSYLGSWLIPRPQVGESIQKRSPSGRVLLGASEDFLQEDGELTGYIIGSISTLLYVAYKIPEVISMKRHRTHMGRSFYCYFLQIFANIAYVLSILSYDRETSDYIINTLPWTIGSIGMITFNLVILSHLLKNKRPKQKSSKRMRNSPTYRIADEDDVEDPNGNRFDGDEGDVDSWVQMDDVGGSLPRIEEEDEEEQRVVDMVTTHAKMELVADDNYDDVTRTSESELSYRSSNNSVYMDSIEDPTQLEPDDLEWDEGDISRSVETPQQGTREEDVMEEIERELGMSVEAFLAADSTTIRSPRTAEFMSEQEQKEADGQIMEEEKDTEDDLEEFWEELDIMKA